MGKVSKVRWLLSELTRLSFCWAVVFIRQHHPQHLACVDQAPDSAIALHGVHLMSNKKEKKKHHKKFLPLAKSPRAIS